jgi:ADP-heptose:LPS heptosyltransferase
MAKILVIRLSAIGDVAMTIPVIYSVARCNPDIKFTFLTQFFLLPVFINRPSNLELIGINTKGSERKLSGLLRFAFAFAKYDFDTVIDLHCVPRTLILSTIFKLYGKKIFTIKKDRRERKLLTSHRKKKLRQLRPVIEKYADVFIYAGLKYSNTFQTLFTESSEITNYNFPQKNKYSRWIGIAPFAGHEGKIYPVEKMEEVVDAIAQLGNIVIFLFGSRGKEENILEKWAKNNENIKNIAGKYSLDQELLLMSRLDLLVSMDSANMHFASLVDTPVISIWGATHPFAGFYGHRQHPDNAIQLNLPCRPCSVYGNKACISGEWDCMKQIKPQSIINKILSFLNTNSQNGEEI